MVDILALVDGRVSNIWMLADKLGVLVLVARQLEGVRSRGRVSWTTVPAPLDSTFGPAEGGETVAHPDQAAAPVDRCRETGTDVGQPSS